MNSLVDLQASSINYTLTDSSSIFQLLFKKVVVVAAYLHILFLTSYCQEAHSRVQILFEVHQDQILDFENLPSVHFSERNSLVKHQTWSITQDSRGILYVADKDGIKAYDGSTWKVIPTETGSTVRSLAASSDNRIFYGAQGEFGEIVTDLDGTLVARSVSRNNQLTETTFGNVLATFITESGVIFQAPEAVFIWNFDSIETIVASNYFHTSFLVNGEFYVRDAGIGLKKLIEGELSSVPGGEVFADLRIYMMASLSDGDILVVTQERGLFRINQNGVYHFKSELSEYQANYPVGGAKRLRVYSGARISKNRYAIGTLGRGIIIIDGSGRIHNILDQNSGLPDHTINFIYLGKDGVFWVAHNNAGIVGINLMSAIVKYGPEYGITGHPNFVLRDGERLLVSTSDRLYAFVEPQVVFPVGRQNSFMVGRFEDISRPWHISASGFGLAVGTDEGLRIFFDKHMTPSNVNCGSDPTFLTFVDDRGRLIAGTKRGLFEVRLEGDRCVLSSVSRLQSEVNTVYSSDSDTIWVGTKFEGVQALLQSSSGDGIYIPISIPAVSDLPTLEIEVGSVGGEPVFVSVEGPYRYSRLNDKFTLDEALWPFSSPEGDSLLALTEDNMGNVWMAFPDSIVKAIPDGAGNYKFETPPALRFKKASTMTILAEDDGVVWFNDGDVLVRYDSKKGDGKKGTHNLLINRVTKYLSDAIIFRGNHVGLDNSIVFSQPESSIPELLYEESELAISYSSSSFTFPEETRYQTRIIGIDSTWSAWTSEKEFRIRKSGAGTYTFQARAKNSDGVISRVGSYSFIVLPPWYFTWWAYLLYVSLTALVAYSGGKYWLMVREHRLAEEQAKELAKEREFNKVLKEANDRLIKANKLKDEFLATTSHELRTPLTSILGFTSVLKDEIPESAEYREFLDIIEDSGNRLMETLNSLLDLAKLRSGMMELNLEISDIYYQCRDGISDLQSSASKKGLMLSINRPDQPLYVELDVLGFLRIIYNLVSNAIKFTEEGRISIELEAEDDLVHIKIIDTGIGIEKEFLPKLFDEFVQESDGAARTHEGFGLGLAITARLVRLMSGTIEVESEKGKGSTFIVTLPRVPAPESKAMRMRNFGINAG